MTSALNVPSIAVMPQPTVQISGKHLIFQLGSEEFAINVMSVKEIMKMQTVTIVPQTPSFVQGVINLRGKIIPVINLRRKFGIEDREDTDLTCIVVVRMQVQGGEQPVGIVVDGVVEVSTFNEEDIEATPDFGLDGVMPYVKGMAKIKGRVKIVLDIDQVLRGNQIERIGLQH